MAKITKMLILDKFLLNTDLNKSDWVLESEVESFIGTKLFVLDEKTQEFVEKGKVTSILIDDENETIKLNDIVSYYDDFDFDFDSGNPDSVYVLYEDANAVFEEEPEPEPEPEPETEEIPEEPEVPETEE